MGVQTERLAFKKTLGVRKAWAQYADAALPVPMRPYVPLVVFVIVALNILHVQLNHQTSTTAMSAPDGDGVREQSVRKVESGKSPPVRPGFRFSKKDGKENYASCDGIYREARGDDDAINGKPYYVNEDKGRFLAWNGKVWEITATHYLAQLLTHHKKHGYFPGTFGGFHAGGGATPDVGDWDSYTVKALPAQDPPQAYRVSGKGGGDAPVAGVYVVSGERDGKPSYRDLKRRTLVWSKADNEWQIRDPSDWEITAAAGAWPEDGQWVDVFVSEVPSETETPRAADKGPQGSFAHKSFVFALKKDGVNAGNCDGTYTVAQGAEDKINGKRFYMNKEKQRLLAATPSGWQIVPLGSLPDLLQFPLKAGTSVEAFHAMAGAEPDQGEWKEYSVAGDFPKSFVFTSRPDGGNYANCDGVYTLAEGDEAAINGKPYFVNSEKERFLAWNGKVWEVTAMYFLPGVLQHHKDHGFWPGAFGGYHNGGGDWPTDGVWDDYFVKDDEPVVLDRRRAFRFRSKMGRDNYGDCDGVYKVAVGADTEINGKPYYVHMTKPRFLAWNGNTWEITALEYLAGVQQHLLSHGFWPGTFGGYHYGGEDRPDDGEWKDYTVTAELPSAYLFTELPRSANYARCDGLYTAATGEDRELNGKPFFLNEKNRRFLAWTGVVWEITATDYLPGIKQHHSKHGFWPGSFGGYHSGGGDLPDDGKWSDYAVTAKYDDRA